MSAVSVPGSSGDAIVLKRGAAKVYVGSAVVKATVTLLENPDFSFDLEYADCSTAEDRRPPLRLPLSSSTTAILSGENDNVVVVQTPQKPGWLGATEIRFTTMARVERTTWIEKIEAAVDALLARPRTSLTGRTYFSITKPTVDTIVGIELLKAVDAEVEGVVIGALSADGAAERHALACTSRMRVARLTIRSRSCARHRLAGSGEAARAAGRRAAHGGGQRRGGGVHQPDRHVRDAARRRRRH